MKWRKEIEDEKFMKHVEKWKKQVLWLLVSSLVLFSGCGSTQSAGKKDTKTTTSAGAVTQTQEESGSTNTSDASNTGNANADFEGDIALQSQSDTAYVLSEVPEYSGSPYVVLENNEPDFTENDRTTEAFETYSNLDALGRCQVAYANICKELMPIEERGRIGMIKPSGWHTVKYNDIIDGNYLYNRCHLIGYQLAGENANEKNLITGTRYLNVQGMLPFEDEVADYVKRTGNHVLYRVTPIFQGEELVARGVEMEAESVEDNGSGVKFHVYCYNVQPGIGIDYATGDSWRQDADEVSSAAESSATNGKSVANVQADTAGNNQSEAGAQTETYILNQNTKKFHKPSCSSVKTIKDTNRGEFTGSRDDLISQGYEPCGRCHP